MPSGVQSPLWGYDKRYASTTTFLSTTTILKDFWFIDNTLCHYKVWYNWLREIKDNYDFILRFSTKTNQSETTTNRNSMYFNYKTRKVDKLFELIHWPKNNGLAYSFWIRMRRNHWRNNFYDKDSNQSTGVVLWWVHMSRKVQIGKNLGFLWSLYGALLTE